MAQKMSKNSRSSWEVDFVRCELSKAEKDSLLKWDLKNEATFDAITRLVDDGFKLTVTADKRNDCVGIWLTSPKLDAGPRQRCLGARGPDLIGAFRAIAFKHCVVLEGEWGDAGNPDDPTSRWG